MSESKHFNYEGNVEMNKPDFLREPQNAPDMKFEIVDLNFLTPARLRFTVNGKEISTMVNVDIVNRKAYLNDGTVSHLSDEIFNYLDRVNSLPEDFFEAPDEVYEEVNKMDPNQFKDTQDILGELE